MNINTSTLNGFVWSFIENFSKQGVNFVIGIILARLLLPEQFGLVGMITVFIAVSTSFINSGFSQALIRKKDCSDVDYSTVFYFNLATAVFFIALLYVSAPAVATFFEEPQLVDILRVLSVALLFDALSMVQRTQLTKRIDFKLQTKLTVISDITSGIVAIIMAYMGFGVWSLIVRQLIGRSLYSALLWFYSKWVPLLVFSKDSFKELFGFGSKLLISGLLNTIFQNIYLIVIGKYFSASQLGFYTQADKFKKLPSNNINVTIQRVSYPVMAQLQDDPVALRAMFIRILKVTMFITLVLMMGLAATADSLILVLLGEKWATTIDYLQLLVFAGMFYPIQSLNINILNVHGRSDLTLKLAVIKKILQIPVIVLGVFYGIEVMIVGMIVNNAISYFLNSYWSKELIDLSSLGQLLEIMPSFLLSLVMGVILMSFNWIFDISPLFMLILQILVGAIFILVCSELIKLKEYMLIKGIIIKRLKLKNG